MSYLTSDPMGLQERLNAMTPEERRSQAQVITDEQYEALQGMWKQWPPAWYPSNDEETLAVWCRNRDRSGFDTARDMGNLPMYIFTLPMRPVEMVFMQVAKAVPWDGWEGLGMLVLVPAMIFGSGFFWFELFKWGYGVLKR